MGYAVSWLCVQGNDPSAVRAALSLEHVSTAQEPFESQYTGLDLGRRGYLIAINDPIDPFIEDTSLSSLSARWRVIACQVEGHTMHCIAQCWSNGRKDWHVEHNAQLDLMHLDATGNLPAQFSAIKEKAFEWQKASKDNDVDYIFEVPSLVAWRLTGFKHDRGFVLGRSRLIEELAASAPAQLRKAGAWWKFW